MLTSRQFYIATILSMPIQPDRIPVITDPAIAARSPERSVLSAIVHGKTEFGVAIVWAAVPAFCKLDDLSARVCFDMALSALSDADQRRVEAMLEDSPYGKELADKYRAHGYEQECAEGERTLLLRQLRIRFGELPAAALGCIEAAESATLERWGERVLTAASLAEVLEDPSSSSAPSVGC